MKLKPSDATRVLTDFIREDRAEVRIYRNRLENLTSSVVVASFAISAFFIAKVTPLTTMELVGATLLIDAGLVAILLLSFGRIKYDLVFLRKALKWRPSKLEALEEGTPPNHIEVFRKVDDIVPDIEDTDLDWLVKLAVIIIVAKTAILTAFSLVFPPLKTGRGLSSILISTFPNAAYGQPVGDPVEILATRGLL